MKKILSLMIFLISSCNLIEEITNSSTSHVIDMAKVPELKSLPDSPEKVLSDFSNVISIQGTYIPSVYNPSNPEIFYVKIYLTNEDQFDVLQRYYVISDSLPIPGLETDSELVDMAKHTCIINYENYSNAAVVYGILNTGQYNHFITNQDVYFSVIRKLTVGDLPDGFLEESFVESMNAALSEENLLPYNPEFAQYWQDLVNVEASLSGTTPKAANLDYGNRSKCNYVVRFLYQENDPNIDTGKLKPLWDMKIIFTRFFHSHPQRTGKDGIYSQEMLAGKKYLMSIKYKTKYARYTSTIFGLAYVYREEITIPDVSSRNIDYSIVGDEAYVMGTIGEIYDFCISQNLQPAYCTYRIKDPSRNGASGMALIYSATFKPTNCNKSTIAHEYGHLMFNQRLWPEYAGIPELLSGTFSGPLIEYPDGTESELYHDNNFSHINEGWADFFSLAFLKLVYPSFLDTQYKRYYEVNYGGKEVLFGSTISNSGVIGTNSPMYFYKFHFPRYYKYASILYDLWDNNDMFYATTGLRNAYSTLNYNHTYFYPSSEYSDKWNWQTNFTALAINNRESKMDRISIGMDKIFLFVTTPYTLTVSDYYLPIETRLSNFHSYMGISQSDLDDVLLLHSPNWPLFITDTQGPEISIDYPAPNALVAMTFNIQGSVRDSFSGLKVNTSQVYYSIFPYTLTNSQTINTGSFIKSISVAAPGTYKVWVSAMDNAGNSSLLSLGEIQVSFDVPLITVNTPLQSFFTTNSLNVLVSGSALVGTSNIENVYFSINGVTNTATGTGNWSFVAGLTDGITNSIKVWARAVNGNVSQVQERKVYVDAAVYVSRTGSDTNPGTRLAPVKTLQKGVDLAASLGLTDVKVAEGVYDEKVSHYQYGANWVCLNIPSRINLMGGFYNNFSTRDWNIHPSIIDGKNLVYEFIISINNSSDVTIDGFQIKNGKRAIFIYGSPIEIFNCMILGTTGTDPVFELIGDIIFSNNTIINPSAGVFFIPSFASMDLIIRNNTFQNIVPYVLLHYLDANIDEVVNNHFVGCNNLYSGISRLNPSGQITNYSIHNVSALNSIDEQLGLSSIIEGNW